MNQITEIKVPDIGDYKDVPVIEIFVKAGDVIKAEQALVSLESDKASIDVPSPRAGTVKSIQVKPGDKVSEGSVLLALEVLTADQKPDETTRAIHDDTIGKIVPREPHLNSDEINSNHIKSNHLHAAQPNQSNINQTNANDATMPTQVEKVIPVKVPDIGDFDGVPVVEVFVKVGDRVNAEQSLIALESDKATMDIPSPAAGIVESIEVKAGDKVSKNHLILNLKSLILNEKNQTENYQANISDTPNTSNKSNESQTSFSNDVLSQSSLTQSTLTRSSSTQQKQFFNENATSNIELNQNNYQKLHSVDEIDNHSPTSSHTLLCHAGPSVRKYARELGVDIGQIRVSDPRGKITHNDINQYVKHALLNENVKTNDSLTTSSNHPLSHLLTVPKVDFSKYGETTSQPLQRIQKLSGTNLHRNWVSIPHVTNCDDADITELEAFRVASNQLQAKEDSKVKLTMLAFIMKASAVALKKFPKFNSSLDGDNQIFKKYCHIGFAADTPKGLMVPVIRDVDQKSVLKLAEEAACLAGLARIGKLSSEQMQGGCFSISSLGGIGTRYFTPIINAPEVAILGVGRSTFEPFWNNKEFVPRLMLPLSLSYDHRVIDGADAARFNQYLCYLLGDFRRVCL